MLTSALRNRAMLVWIAAMALAIAIVLTAGLSGVILVAILIGTGLRGRPRLNREIARASKAAFIVLGWSIGSRFDQDAIASLIARTPQIAIALGGIFIMALVMAVLLHRSFGFSARSAFVATAPGGLPELSSTAALDGVDLVSVMPVQVMRVLVLLILLPTALALLT